MTSAEGVIERAIPAPDADENGFRLVPVDVRRLLAEGVPGVEMLDPPYFPRAARVWAFGPAEGGKSIFFQWTSARITRAGGIVVYVSQENPLATDLDRWARLRPDFERLRFFHNPGIDLADRSHFVELAVACNDASMVVIDTISASWSGDENDNAAVVAFDREVLAPLVRLTGVTPGVIHHSGHPQAFRRRGGVGAGRGASAMGQKADVVLVFESVGAHEFTVEHAKNRTPGGRKEPKARFRVVDADDGGLDLERVGTATDERVAEAMEAVVEIVAGDGPLGTNALKVALKDRGFGSSTIDPALRGLRAEDPPRVRQTAGEVLGADGKRRNGKPWVAA